MWWWWGTAGEMALLVSGPEFKSLAAKGGGHFHQERTLAAKSNHLSSIPETHFQVEKRTHSARLFPDFHMYT